MSKSWQAYVHHILECIEKIHRIQSRGDITQDDILYDATLRNLQTLSEATQKLTEQKRSLCPDIPWKEINGFRNILVHNYLGNIDPVTVKAVIEQHLQPLAFCMEKLLEETDG